MDTAGLSGHTLACTKCRSHRVKCDRAQPACRRRTRLGHACVYPNKNQAAAYFSYALALEAEVASLEHQLAVSDKDVAPGLDGLSPMPLESLINNLFSQGTPTAGSGGLAPAPVPPRSDNVRILVHDLAQVSLSAMTAPASSSQDFVLGSLIYHAALPPLDSRNGLVSPDTLPPPIALPDRQISLKVLTRFCSDLLPSLPYITPSALLAHMDRAYDELAHPAALSATAHYSIFVTFSTLASTAVFLSPASGPNAARLHAAALVHLHAFFTSRDLVHGSLLDLEATVVLAHFAALVRSAGLSPYADTRALSSLAIRITVDLGLHTACHTDRERQLFWASYALDREASLIDRLPLGLPDLAIHCDMPPVGVPFPFPFYRLLSRIYGVSLNDSDSLCGSDESHVPVAVLSAELDQLISQASEARVPTNLIDPMNGRLRQLLSLLADT